MKIQIPVFFRNLLIIFPVFLWLSISIHGQTTANCFNLERIKRLYNSTFIEINSILFRESWEIVSNSTYAPFVFENDTLKYDRFSKWNYDLSVNKIWLSLYRKQGLQPVLVLQVSKNCYEAIEAELKLNNPIAAQVVEDVTLRLRIFQIQEGVDLVLPSTKSKSYLITICNYDQVESLMIAQKAEKEAGTDLLQEQILFIETTLEQADSLKNLGNYAAALLLLEQAMTQPFIEREELTTEAQEVKNKKDFLIKDFELKKYDSHLRTADSAFAKENYPMAKEYLLKAQQIDSDSQIVLQKLYEIGKIESMSVIREDSTFNYLFYNKSTCNDIQNTVFKKLRNCFLGIDAGVIRFTYKLHTDMKGKNVSVYQISIFSLHPAAKSTFPIDTEERWALFLDTLIHSPIPAVKIDYLYVNAVTKFEHHASWKTSLFKAHHKGKKITLSQRHIAVAEEQAIKGFFMNNPSFPKGEYKVEKKEILYQDSMYRSLAIKKFYTVGAEAMAYSMLFPGVGSLAATQGKKGWGFFSSAIVFGGLGVAGIIAADKVVKNPKTAKALRYASYASFGVTGAIYISDIFVALKRGMDNMKRARALKEKLKDDAIYIQEIPQQI